MRLMLQGYITLFVIFIVATIILYVPIFFIMKKKGRGFIRQSSYLLCFFSLFLIIFATLILFNLPISFSPERHTLNLIPFQWLWEENIKQRVISEIRPNIMIFIPLGFLIPVVFKRMRKIYMTALVVFVITFSVEFFQYFIGRSSDIDDLIANLLGGIIGYAFFKFFSFIFKNKTCWDKFVGL